MRECVYGPRSLGSGMNQKSRKKPLPMWPDTSRRRGRKSPFWSLLKTSCFEKTAGVCSTLAQFLAEMSFQRVMKPLYKPFNTYRTLSITENIRIGRSGWRKTPRHHRHPAHRCDRRPHCPGWKAAPAPGSAGRHPQPPDL